jgi:hypothetical protein
VSAAGACAWVGLPSSSKHTMANSHAVHERIETSRHWRIAPAIGRPVGHYGLKE